jgi:hypothetical protein
MGPLLEMLNIIGVEAEGEAKNGLSDEILHVLAENCPNLEAFHYPQPRNDTFTGLISAEAVMVLIKGCNRLEALRLCLPEHVCDAIWEFWCESSTDSNLHLRLHLAANDLP